MKHDVQKKASKADIDWMLALHADLDPSASADLVTEQQHFVRRRHAGLLAAGTKPVDDIDRLEAHNIVLEQTLGADRCHNIDRIMRLPGTINLPNRKKRLAGREPALASVVEAHWDRRYRLEDFQPATASDAPNENPGKANRHDTEAPPSEVDIDALPVSTRIRNLIRGVHGHERYYQSRSEAVMAVLVAMAANGCSDEQMTAVVFDQRFPDGAHVRDHKKPNPYLARQIAKARKLDVLASLARIPAPMVLSPWRCANPRLCTTIAESGKA